MWLSLQDGRSLLENGLQELSKFRQIEADWAMTQLPVQKELKQHPYCEELEHELNVIGGRLTARLTRISDAHTFQYTWKGNEIKLSEDPVSELVYYHGIRGDAFLGEYRSHLYAYSFPCYGLMPLKGDNGYVPVFYSQSQLSSVFESDNQENLVFFRNRPLSKLRSAVGTVLVKSLRDRTPY